FTQVDPPNPASASTSTSAFVFFFTSFTSFSSLSTPTQTGALFVAGFFRRLFGTRDMFLLEKDTNCVFGQRLVPRVVIRARLLTEERNTVSRTAQTAARVTSERGCEMLAHRVVRVVGDPVVQVSVVAVAFEQGRQDVHSFGCRS